MRIQMPSKSMLVLGAALALTLGVAAEGQSPPAGASPDEKTRQLWDDAFRSKRPSASKPALTPARPGPPRPGPSAERLGEAFVGITVLRLRAARPAEQTGGAALIVAGEQKLVAERVPSGESLQPGDRVRLVIESARAGYLYLIDREQYSDGSLGEPHVIFPTTRIRGGENRVAAGRLMEVPDAADTPSFFTLKQNRPDQIGELVTILVTPEPLAEVAPARGPLRIAREQAMIWEQRWKAPVQVIETDPGGRLYTRVEQRAGETARLLTQDEPIPQTLYKVEARPGEPVLLVLALLLRPTPP